MMEIKWFLSILAIALLFIGYFPYLRDTINGKTRPHIFSYIIWALTTFIVFGIQLQSGGGAGAWVTFAIGCMMLVVLGLSYKNGRDDITKGDFITLVVALLAIPLWLLANLPLLSLVILTAIDLLGFLPGMRKSWVDPWSETISLYQTKNSNA